MIPFERATLVAPGLVRFDGVFKPGAECPSSGGRPSRRRPTAAAGIRIGPPQIALLSSVGLTAIPVHRRPRVAVLATGDETIEPGKPLGSGQIWDANSAAITAMISGLGAVPVPLGIARDDSSELIRRFDAVARLGVELLITSGGVSAGDFDIVKQVLRDRGSVEIWRVRMKPGRPLAFGRDWRGPGVGLARQSGRGDGFVFAIRPARDPDDARRSGGKTRSSRSPGHGA